MKKKGFKLLKFTTCDNIQIGFHLKTWKLVICYHNIREASAVFLLKTQNSEDAGKLLQCRNFEESLIDRMLVALGGLRLL